MAVPGSRVLRAECSGRVEQATRRHRARIGRSGRDGPQLLSGRSLRNLLVLSGFLVIVAAGSGAAWGCVPQPLIALSPQASGPPGSRVTVNALAITGLAEIRWSTFDGPQLGTAMGPNFSVEVTIPEASAGLYAIIVVERSPDGGLGSTGRAAFEVTGASSFGSDSSTSSSGRSSGTSPTNSTPALSPPSVSGTLLVAGGASLVAIGAVAGSVLSKRGHR